MKQAVMEAKHAKVIKSIEGVTHNVLAHLKMIPSLLSIYDALWLSKELRQSQVYTLSNPEEFVDLEEVSKTPKIEECMITITFEDLDS